MNDWEASWEGWRGYEGGWFSDCILNSGVFIFARTYIHCQYARAGFVAHTSIYLCSCIKIMATCTYSNPPHCTAGHGELCCRDLV